MLLIILGSAALGEPDAGSNFKTWYHNPRCAQHGAVCSYLLHTRVGDDSPDAQLRTCTHIHLTGTTETAAVAGKIATEAVENIRTVLSLTRENAFEQMYEEMLQTRHRNVLKRAHITGSCYAVGHAFVYFAHSAGFPFGAYLIRAGRMTPEGMFTVFTAIAYGAIAIGETLVWTPEYSKAKVGAAHLFALLKKKPTMDSCSQAGKN
ncbi:hypothetical protein ACRRTK_017880 [Alexandromys fortis]